MGGIEELQPQEQAGGKVSPSRFLIVGLGASAGGLEVLERFFSNLPAQTGLAFVVIQHLDPHHDSLLPELLSKWSKIPVQHAEHGLPVESDHVYVIPPNTIMTIEGGCLKLSRPLPRGQHNVIDVFFRSLARDQKEKAVGIVLSGTVTDGTLGLRAIKEEMGLSIVQEPSTARYSSMPQSAMQSGCADYVLHVEQMPAKLMEYGRHVIVEPCVTDKGQEPSEDEALAREACTIMLARTGRDFRHYKPTTLLRRIQRRAQLQRVGSLRNYVEMLREKPDEVENLIRDLLIGVTQFFRDTDAFEFLNKEVIGQLFDKPEEEPIRVWVAGCATGEEAYSIAILLREHMERTGAVRPVQLFATDIDDEALDLARRGTFPLGIADQMSPTRLERFFVKQNSTYKAVQEIREMCIFSLHDLLRDPPFSRIDLLSCRNVLIYFDAAIQKRLLPTLHYALRPDGYLFLGPSEHVAGNSDLFRVIDKKYRLFQRRATDLYLPTNISTKPLMPFSRTESPVEPPRIAGLRHSLGDRFQRVLLQDFSPAAVLMTENGEILHISGRTGRVLELAQGPFENNVFGMVRRELRLDLRAAIVKAQRSEKPVVLDGLKIESDGGPFLVRLTVRPLNLPNADQTVLMVVFEERPGVELPAVDLDTTGRSESEALIHALETELGRTREDLQTTIEELETSNEEMKSSNEELLSMNEELQSTNEELHTSKEELQSMNEELSTVNTELNKKIDELNQANDDQLNIFQSTRIATIFLDRSLRIKRFTPDMASLFRLIDADIGRPIADISAPFADRDWLEDAKEVLRTLIPTERQVRASEANAWYVARILPYRTTTNVIDGVVVTFVDVTPLKRMQIEAEELAGIVASAHDAIVGYNNDGTITSWNRSAEQLYGYLAEEAIGRNVTMIMPRKEKNKVEDLAARDEWSLDAESLETVHYTKDGQPVHVWLSISPRLDEGGQRAGLSLIARDVTMRRKAEAESERLTRELARRVEELSTVLDLLPLGVAVTHDPKAQHITGNKACAELFRMPPNANLSPTGENAELVHYRFFQNEKELPLGSYPIERAARRGEVIRAQACELRFDDDTRRRLLVSAVPLFDEQGKTRGAIAAFVDVTAERLMSEELQLAAIHKDEFLAMLGHELRNPLAAMATALELMKRRKGASEQDEIHRPLGIMERQLRHMARLIDDLLDLARVARRKIQLQLEPLDLVPMLKSAAEDHQPTARARGLEIALELPDHPVWIHGDRVRIMQVIANLLSNALKFTPPEGQITITVNEERDHARFTIRDTGAGIPPELLGKIFEPFEQGAWSLDQKYGGLGLGLALSRHLIEMHEGTLEAESPGLGKGSCFTVRLPLERDAGAPAPMPADTLPVSLKVLVIEDIEDIAEALREILKDLGHSAEIALDGEVGLALARKLRPDVVLCDIGLPGAYDGYEVAKAIREDPELRSTYLIALSGYSRDEDKKRALAAGFDLHMTKPPEISRLDRLLRRFGQERGKAR